MRRSIVSLVILALLSGAVPGKAADDAVLAGRVVRSDRSDPVVGATVRLVGPAGGTVVASVATTRSGDFRIENLARRNYRLGIETSDGVYVVDQPISLASTPHRTVVLALRPGPALAPAGVWDSRTGAGLLVAGSAIVLGLLLAELTEEGDEPEASPVAPAD